MTGTYGLAIIAAITYLFNRKIDQRRVLEEPTRKEKIALYLEIIEFLLNIMSPEESGRRPDQVKVMEFMSETTPRLITYGTNPVVRLWGKFIRTFRPTDGSGVMDMVDDMEALLKAMRKDVGHTKVGSFRGDLARLFINDIDEVLAESKATKRRNHLELPSGQ
jgi:hypothetical protein